MPFHVHLLEIVRFKQPLETECRVKMSDLLITNPKGLRDQICAKIIHIKLFHNTVTLVLMFGNVAKGALVLFQMGPFSLLHHEKAC